MSAYSFTVEYRKGKNHINADVMSRCFDIWDCKCSEEDMLESLRCGPCKKCQKRAVEMQSSKLWNYEVNSKDDSQSSFEMPADGSTSVSIDLPETSKVCEVKTRSKSTKDCDTVCTEGFSFSEITHSKSDLRKMQEQDQNIGPLYRWLVTGKRPTLSDVQMESTETRYYLLLWESLRLIDGLVYREFHKKDGTGNFLQFLVPWLLRRDIMFQMHDSLQGGHLGQKKTRNKIQQRYFWFEMKVDINNWVLKCDICAANKTPNQTPKAPLGNMKVGGVLDRLSIDILGPLIETPRQNRYILVATCHFTKWVEIFDLPDQTASTCARVLLNEVFARYGICNTLHSDQGRNFESGIFQDLCRMLGIKKTRTSARNPRCNGQTERFNRTLVRMIKAYLKNEQTDWDLHLGCLAAAYRSTPHESSQMTPNLLMLGREVRLPAELTHGSYTNNETVTSYGEYVDKLRERLQTAHSVARKYIEKSAKTQKDRYDAKIFETSFLPGDLVWYLVESCRPGKCLKLEPNYTGPYVVICRFSPLNLKIQMSKSGTTKVVHHNKLKKYEGDNPPSWVIRLSKKVRKNCRE